ncbi:MAG: hypothetical protein ABR613_04315 [Actinomycetota bacterium]
MSQPRRRRRRRRKPSEPSKPSADAQQVREQASQLDASRSSSSRSRSRRRRRRGGEPQIASPKSSEDLVRALPRERPPRLTAPPDGQSLEAIIGELQSNFGVPAYPQEYRITIKVAEEKQVTPAGNGAASSRAPTAPPEAGPRREKAPAAPRVAPEGSGEVEVPAEKAARRRRSRRRRGRGGRGPSGGQGGPSGGAPSAGPNPPPPPA